MTDQDQQVLIDLEIGHELEETIVALTSVAAGFAVNRLRRVALEHMRALGHRLIDQGDALDREWLAAAQRRIDDRKREEKFAAEQLELC